MPLNCRYLLTLILLVSFPVLADKSISYIYIEAGEGNSSGGHAALQLGNDVFHYQYIDPGLIQLHKQTADDFEYNYRYAANRTLHLNRIPVSEQTYQLLTDYFNLQYQLQTQQFSLRDNLSKDRFLLDLLLDRPNQSPSEALSVEAAGLFFTDRDFIDSPNSPPQHQPVQPDSATMAALHQIVQQTYGDRFLGRRYTEIARQLEQLTPQTGSIDKFTLDTDSLPPTRYTFANRHLDLTAALLAILAIEQHRPLRSDAFVAPPGPEFVLTDEEIATLKQHRERLLTTWLKLFVSRRPDWGFAVLTTSARLIALDQSIRLKRLVWVDTYETQSKFISEIYQPEFRDTLQTHTRDARHYFIAAKKALSDNPTFGEQDYSWLEMHGNRYAELKKTTIGKTAIRLYGANLVPTKSIKLPLLTPPRQTKSQLMGALSRLEQLQAYYDAELQRLYAYHLMTRNCVTELFQSINRAFIQQAGANEQIPVRSKPKPSVNQLGDELDRLPGNFIPLVSYYAVQSNYPITDTQTLPSLRMMRLQQLYQKEPDLVVFLRENNTLTSTLYTHNPNDSFFIFFTDNQFLLRPLFGALNTLAGIGQTVLGVLAWPFDAGNLLNSGTTGILMSLPELAFFNLRKGSYRYLPYSQLSSSTLTLNRAVE